MLAQGWPQPWVNQEATQSTPKVFASCANAFSVADEGNFKVPGLATTLG